MTKTQAIVIEFFKIIIIFERNRRIVYKKVDLETTKLQKNFYRIKYR